MRKRAPTLALAALRTPLGGDLTLIRSERGLLGSALGAAGRVWLLRRAREAFPGARIVQRPGAFADEQRALRDLLAGRAERIGVSLDWRLVGERCFARRVLEQVREIPPGLTAGCGELAAAVGAPGAVRAVERVVARCPLVLVVPTHRVAGPKEASPVAISDEARDLLLRLEGQKAAAVSAPALPWVQDE